MRAHVLASALVLVVLLVRPASAPPAPEHLEIIHGTLAPRGTQTWTNVSFGGEPLSKDWVFLLQAKVVGATLNASLALHGNVKKEWTIPPPEPWYATTILPETGVYDLTVSNPGTMAAEYWMYFDQSCNCLAKSFPAETPGGPVIPGGYMIFYIDIGGPSAVSADFAKPPHLSLKVTAALLSGSDGQWPSSFNVLDTSDATVQRQADPGFPPVDLYVVDVRVAQPARVYYFVQAGEFDSANYSGESLVVGPHFQVTATGTNWIPLVTAGIAAALAVAGVVILWRGRRPANAIPKTDRKDPKGEGSKDRRGGKKPVKPSPRGGARGGTRTRTPPERKRRS